MKSASPSDLEILKGFVANSKVIGLETEIKDKTIDLRSRYSIKLPHATITATALTYDMELITRNIPDFSALEGLRLLNPFSTT